MKYNAAFIGPVSLDINIDCNGNIRRELGGAVVQAGFSAGKCGFNVCVLTKSALPDSEIRARFKGSNANIIHLQSNQTCSIRNQYFTPDKEKRICTSLAVCDTFTVKDLEALDGVETDTYCFAGLVRGNFDGSLFAHMADNGKIAVDVQCLLRRVNDDGTMTLCDWDEKCEYLPYIHYLKTDAAEAEILTGESDRLKAAGILAECGAHEVMITHGTEIIIHDGRNIYACPLKPRNLSGRTGRGDTAFSGYIASRCECDIPEALLFASALVSLKMESPGPFMGNRDSVMKYIEEFYSADSVRVIRP